MPNWTDTLEARQRGEVSGFHDVNASVEERKAAEREDGADAHAFGENVTLAGGDSDGDDGYDAMTVAQLQAELDSRGLDTKGRKAELVARLEEADAG